MGGGGWASRECFGPSGGVGHSVTARAGMRPRVRLAIRPKAFSRGPSYLLDSLLGDRWGLIGLDGQWVVAPSFRRLDLLVGGLYAETFRGEQGFINTRGTFIRSGHLGASYQPAK